MEKINVAEILRKCPREMELNCTMYENVKLKHVSVYKDEDYPICIETKSGFITKLTKYGQNVSIDDAKCVIFPKGKTTWEGFVPFCQFKDGDVLVHTQNERFIMSIYHKRTTERIIKTHCILWDRDEGLSVGKQICCYDDSVRLATEEEKQKLFQAIESNGYKWNEKTKTLEKIIKPKFKVGDIIQNKYDYKVEITEVSIDDECYGYLSKLFNGIGSISFEDQNEWELVSDEIKPKFKVGDKITDGEETMMISYIDNEWYYEIVGDNLKRVSKRLSIIHQDKWELVSSKFDITTIKPFDKVLVRWNSSEKWYEEKWRIQYFEKYDETCEYPFICMGYKKFQQCIPYKGNEHLHGTIDDCDEYYKIW